MSKIALHGALFDGLTDGHLIHLRRSVDEVDADRARLLARRLRRAQSIAALKYVNDMPVFNAEREREVSARVLELAATHGLPPEGLLEISRIERQMAHNAQRVTIDWLRAAGQTKTGAQK